MHASRQAAGGWIRPFSLAKCTDAAAPLAEEISAPVAATGLEDGGWSEFGFPARGNQFAVYDTAGDRMFVFGGSSIGGIAQESLVLPLDAQPRWSVLSASGTAPSGEVIGGAFIDPARQRVLVHAYAGDIWILSLAGSPSWTHLGTHGGPAPGASLVFDSNRDRFVSFGGNLGLGYGADTWELRIDDANPVWTMLTPSGVAPSGRAYASAVYDRARDRMVLFGGQNCTQALADVWTLAFGDSEVWIPLTATGAPATVRAPTVYDPRADRMLVLTGPASSEVWAFDLAGSGSWARLDPTPAAPADLSIGSFVLDTRRNRLIDYGGMRAPGPSSAVWSFSLETPFVWRQLTQPLPGTRYWHTAIRDPLRDRMIVFGGFQDLAGAGTLSNDTWALPLADGQEWIPILPAGTPPPPMATHTAIYDPDGDRMIVYGGDTASRSWSLSLADNPAWQELTPIGPFPTGRFANGAAYDPRRKRMLIFGGDVSGPTLTSSNDVWALSTNDPSAWTQLSPDGTPPLPRAFAICVYDPIGDRMLALGGLGSGVTPDEVWALTLDANPTWTRLTPTGTPPPDFSWGSAMYDSLGQRIVIYGGENSPKVWALSLAGAPSWQALAPAGNPPAPRFGNTVIYDPLRDRMIQFAGINRNDTWALSWNRSATPTLLSLADIAVDGRAVQVRWYAGDWSAVQGHIERSLTGSEWTDVGGIIPDGSGLVSYVDTEVTPGQRYGYRLWLLDGVGGHAAGEAWIVVPVTRGLSLDAVVPNPMFETAEVSITLPRSGPATLEMIDIAGRITKSIDVGALGPGSHGVAITRGSGFVAGVYFLRLTQAGRSVTRKVEFLR